MSLMDSITEAQMKIQEAISKAFNAKEVMEMYSSKQGEYYRMQMELVKSQFLTGRIEKDQYIKEALEALVALSKVDTLTPEEKKMLEDFENKKFDVYTEAGNKIDKNALFGKKNE